MCAAFAPAGAFGVSSLGAITQCGSTGEEVRKLQTPFSIGQRILVHGHVQAEVHSQVYIDMTEAAAKSEQTKLLKQAQSVAMTDAALGSESPAIIGAATSFTAAGAAVSMNGAVREDTVSSMSDAQQLTSAEASTQAPPAQPSLQIRQLLQSISQQALRLSRGICAKPSRSRPVPVPQHTKRKATMPAKHAMEAEESAEAADAFMPELADEPEILTQDQSRKKRAKRGVSESTSDPAAAGSRLAVSVDEKEKAFASMNGAAHKRALQAHSSVDMLSPAAGGSAATQEAFLENIPVLPGVQMSPFGSSVQHLLVSPNSPTFIQQWQPPSMSSTRKEVIPSLRPMNSAGADPDAIDQQEERQMEETLKPLLPHEQKQKLLARPMLSHQLSAAPLQSGGQMSLWSPWAGSHSFGLERQPSAGHLVLVGATSSMLKEATPQLSLQDLVQPDSSRLSSMQSPGAPLLAPDHFTVDRSLFFGDSLARGLPSPLTVPVNYLAGTIMHAEPQISSDHFSNRSASPDAHEMANRCVTTLIRKGGRPALSVSIDMQTSSGSKLMSAAADTSAAYGQSRLMAVAHPPSYVAGCTPKGMDQAL
jgi:hypothetical protein